ncbi:MAG: 4Fe-4S binding protein [bacterium]
MKKRILNFTLVLYFLLISYGLLAQAVERFPKPDFQTDYVRPDLLTPEPRSAVLETLDVVVLIAALSLASFFALKQRSRRNVFLLMVFSLIYFGFYRKGCICSVGAIQNMIYALFHSDYTIPLMVIAFFVIPLVFTLFFGRTFCAAVCPLGAIQDAVVLKPNKVPGWLAHVLSLFPYIYLGLAVLFAATGAGFIICQYDPFVGIFRFGASFNMVVLGVSMLVLGTVVARPYCRFLCPYGVLLNWMSRLSKKHITITPDLCNNCRLCEESCPFGAIQPPVEAAYPGDKERGIRRLALLLMLLPVIVICSGWVVYRMHIPLSRYHFTVRLVEDIQLENAGRRSETIEETRTFRASERPTEELVAEARTIQNNFKTGGWILGGFLGLILGFKIIQLTVQKKRIEYSIDRGNCVSCARCVSYCPYEQVRLGIITPEEIV